MAASDRSISRFVFVLLAGLLLALQLRDASLLLSDPDTYWHISVGQRIWNSGSFPHIDEFSHTFQGHPWIANDWLIDLLLFGAYSVGDWRTLVLLTACVIAATYALLYLVLSRQLRLSIAIGTATAAYILSSLHFLAQPYIFAFPLVIIWFAGLVSAVESRASPPTLLLPVMVLWANIHGSFVLGLVFAVLLAAEAVFAGEPSKRVNIAKDWAIFLATAFLASCATPYGYQPITLTLTLFTGNEAFQTLAEWRPMFAHSLFAQDPPIIPALVLTFLFLAFYYGARVPFWRLLQILVLAYEMLSYVRLTPLFSIVTPILLMGPLAHQFPFMRSNSDLETSRRIFDALSGVSRKFFYPAMFSLLLLIVGYRLFGPTISPRPSITPAGAVDFMIKHDLRGNIYNHYDFGGYLIFRGVKTFIDGRIDQLFSDGFLSTLNFYRTPNGFLPILDKYHVSLALVMPRSIEAQELERSPFWAKVYSDDVSSLYAKV